MRIFYWARDSISLFKRPTNKNPILRLFLFQVLFISQEIENNECIDPVVFGFDQDTKTEIISKISLGGGDFKSKLSNGLEQCLGIKSSQPIQEMCRPNNIDGVPFFSAHLKAKEGY